MITIAHVITNRASYGRVKAILDCLHHSDDFDLKLIVAGAGMVVENNYPIEYCINPLILGDEKKDMVTSTGVLAVQLPTILEQLKPDVVLIHGDRYEQLGVAMTCAYMGIPIAHTEGGEITGCIDDKVRNAITAMADYHFVVTERSKNRLIDSEMLNDFIVDVGSPALDVVRQADLTNNQPEPYILVLYHPNTTAKESIEPVIDALENVPCKKIVVNCNVDAGSKGYLKKLHATKWEFVKDLPPEEFYRLLANCEVAVGNSSSFIKEGAFLGTKAVIVGTRQDGREHGDNVHFSDCERWDIELKVKNMLQQPRREPDYRFGNGYSADKIVNVLKNINWGR